MFKVYSFSTCKNNCFIAKHFVVGTYHILFFPCISSNGYLNCFNFLAFMHNATMNIHIQVLCGRMFHFS